MDAVTTPPVLKPGIEYVHSQDKPWLFCSTAPGKVPMKVSQEILGGGGGEMLCHLPGSHVSAEVMGLATALLQVVNQLAM